jgi:Right handed beta helix region
MPERGLAAHDATGDAPMRGLQILNNIVRDSASDNIYLSQVADSLAEGNSSSGSKAEHGMYLTNAGSDNTTLRGNRLFNNAKDGLHMNGDIRYGGDGIHKNVVIDGNIIYGNAVNAMDLDGVQDTTIQNNLVYDNGRNGVRVFQIDASAGPKNLRIINNTIVMRSGGGWAIKLTEDAGGHVIFNNVLLAEGATGSIAVGNTNFVSENNATSNTFSLDGDKTNISLQAWKAAGHDATSFSTTSVATFVGGGDYRPKAGALVINAGRAALSSITAPTKDIIGAARPAGVGVDIGAYESAGN